MRTSNLKIARDLLYYLSLEIGNFFHSTIHREIRPRCVLLRRRNNATYINVRTYIRRKSKRTASRGPVENGRTLVVAFNTLSHREESVRGSVREGGTGVTAINSSPIGPPLILLRFRAFSLRLLFLLLILFVVHRCSESRYTRAISVNQIRRWKTSQRRGRRWLLRSKWNA